MERQTVTESDDLVWCGVVWCGVVRMMSECKHCNVFSLFFVMLSLRLSLSTVAATTK